ncbi:[citrate (pro-3S)-lyase] ligase [Trichloromonas sp.]|uniref:[citrate (pro-3S)-lyase] ligase n=1 Tax=Trichloromonas sp. TaxID=3069249 RepID=UPI003D819DB8
MVTELMSRRELEQAKNLIETNGLAFERNYDTLVGIFEGRQLVAVAARDKNILKMFAIADSHQGGACLGELATELIRSGFPAGYDNFFVFTRPQSAASFAALGFATLVQHPQAVLLEYGGALPRYLESHSTLVRPGANGAVVVNCNPFTRGHRYLIEQAAAQVEHLYVFVVREDRSAFPFTVRLQLVKDGVADLPNVSVLDSSYYAVSAVTFPGYFLKDDRTVARVQMEIDLTLFARHLAPFFHITRRFIGTEPYCRTTRNYSAAMKELLPRYGIETVEIERINAGEQVVSAYRVRELLRREAYEELRALVPQTTYNYLMSDPAADIRAKLRIYDRRH